MSGLLAVGSQSGLSVYTLILENDLLTWSKKWATRYVHSVNRHTIGLTRQVNLASSHLFSPNLHRH